MVLVCERQGEDLQTAEFLHALRTEGFHFNLHLLPKQRRLIEYSGQSKRTSPRYPNSLILRCHKTLGSQWLPIDTELSTTQQPAIRLEIEMPMYDKRADREL